MINYRVDSYFRNCGSCSDCSASFGTTGFCNYRVELHEVVEINVTTPILIEVSNRLAKLEIDFLLIMDLDTRIQTYADNFVILPYYSSSRHNNNYEYPDCFAIISILGGVFNVWKKRNIEDYNFEFCGRFHELDSAINFLLE